MIIKKFIALPIVLICFSLYSQAQVKNYTSVYVAPNTDVHVLGALENVTGTSSFTVDEESLLYVGGDLNNNGTFTFENDASLLRGEGTADAGSGTYYVRRQGATGPRYNYWGTPVVNSGSVPGNPSYSYDEEDSTQDPDDDNNPNPDPGWDAYNGTMTPGEGYAGWSANLVTFTDNAVNNGNVDPPMNNLHNYNPAPLPLVAGTPFNLVGNPYPSGLHCWNLVHDNPGVFGSLYFWVDDATQGSGYSAGDYAIWNYAGVIPNPASGSSANGSPVPNGVIKTGQGFLIRNGDIGTGIASLAFRNEQRVANTESNAFFRSNADESRLWLSINGNGPEFHSQILVAALEDATNGEDMLYDAVRLPVNTGAFLASVNGLSKYAILAFPPPTLEETIPLDVFVGESGIYTFKADEMIGFQGLDVYFTDAAPSGGSVLLEEGTTISVNLSSGNYEGRFFLNFMPNLTVGINEEEKTTLKAWTFGDRLNVEILGELDGPSTLQLYDMSGRLILEKAEFLFVENRVEISLKGISTGTYIVRVLNDKSVLSQKVLKR